MRVKDLMTKGVITVGPEATLKDVARILDARHISGLPVAGDGGEVLGVVSEADILYKETGPEPRSRGLLGWVLGGEAEAETKFAARTAREAMSSPAICIKMEKPVAEAARKMTELSVNRLPVLDQSGTLVGIITRGDLVGAFARTDAELLREIRDDVIVKALWIPAERVDVRVRNGEVTLSGRVETKSQAEMVAEFVLRVAGVVSVTSNLTWEYDEQTVGRSSSRVPLTPR
jgi:CBS domain-containing protein